MKYIYSISNLEIRRGVNQGKKKYRIDWFIIYLYLSNRDTICSSLWYHLQIRKQTAQYHDSSNLIHNNDDFHNNHNMDLDHAVDDSDSEV